MDESPVPSTLPPGTRIRDYIIEEFIAAGGFGSVYRVRDHRVGDRRPGEGGDRRVAAMKILHPELQARGDAFVRFLREADVLERIRHPNIVEVYDSGSLGDGRAFVVMELLTGRDLDQCIERDGPLDPRRSAALLQPICDALTCAHDSNVIHRDVKASNVFLAERDGEPRVVLLDFGLAKIVEAGGLALTSSRLGLGTPASMAPEQIRGEDIDPRTDIYALGGLLYHMLTGKLPFHDKSRTVMQYMHLHGQRPRASTRINVGPAVDAVIARAMASDRRSRFATPGEFLSALRRALAASSSPGQVSGEPAGGSGGQASQLADTGHPADHESRRQESDPEQAVAIYVDIRVVEDRRATPTGRPGDRAAGHDEADDLDGDDAREAAEDRLFAAMDEILAATEPLLDERGFQRAIEGSSAILFVRPLAAGHDDRIAGWRDAARTALELERVIAEMEHEHIHVNLCLHTGAVQRRDGRIDGGELLRVERWAPDDEMAGVTVVAAGSLAGTAVVTLPIADRTDRVRLIAVTSRDSDARDQVTSSAGHAGFRHKDTGERAMHTEMMANIGRQVATLVHDLRTPLAVVIGNLEVVLDNARRGQPLGDDDCEAIEDAMRAARQLMETSAGLLEASAVRTYSAATRRSIALPELVDHAIRLSERAIRSRARIEVRHDAPRQILGSPGRLTQVLVNLLVNAAQAIPEDRTPAEGRITIHTETVPGARTPERVRLTIRDNGVGMDPEVQDHIFEPYFTTKEVGEGTGLGLPLVREIIEQHRGTITVESRPGAGSCFVIELPAPPDSGTEGRPHDPDTDLPADLEPDLPADLEPVLPADAGPEAGS